MFVVEVGGREIRIVDDERTQSVNICTPDNREGEYEQVFYYCGRYRVTAEELRRHTDLANAVKFLRRRLWEQVHHFSPDGPSNS